jgi:hypothetical protein
MHALPVIILVQGDESLDGINAVPTEKTALILFIFFIAPPYRG